MATAAHKPSADAVLILVDIQIDFCSGGALAVPDGEQIVPLANRLSQQFSHVVATQDWHPAGHASFASSHPGRAAFESVQLAYGEQTLWPDHCVQGSAGAAFHADLDLAPVQLVVRKGFRQGIDSYSAFFENDRTTSTGLAGYLRDCGLKKAYFCGLAGDICVHFSAMDAAAQGFETYFIEDACRAIDANGMEKAAVDMAAAGISMLKAQTLL